MKNMFRPMFLALSLASGMTVASIPTVALAQDCVIKKGYYVPYNCTETGKTTLGQFIMICC